MRSVITVLLTDDRAIVRAGSRAMLSREADLDVVATADRAWRIEAQDQTDRTRGATS